MASLSNPNAPRSASPNPNSPRSNTICTPDIPDIEPLTCNATNPEKSTIESNIIKHLTAYASSVNLCAYRTAQLIALFHGTGPKPPDPDYPTSIDSALDGLSEQISTLSDYLDHLISTV